MEKIGYFVRYFLYITTFVLVVYAINIWVLDIAVIPSIHILYILMSGALTAFITVLFDWVKENYFSEYLGMMLHYLCLVAVMFGCGVLFDWISLSLNGILAMAISVGIVYVLTFLTYYFVDRRRADEINRCLKDRYENTEIK